MSVLWSLLNFNFLVQCLFAGNAYFCIHKYSRTSCKQTPKMWKLFFLIPSRCSLYGQTISLLFTLPRPNLIRGNWESLHAQANSRIIEQVKIWNWKQWKKKLYQINAVEPWLTYYIVGPLKIKIVFHIIFYLQSCIFFYIQFSAQVQCLLIYECRLQLESSL